MAISLILKNLRQVKILQKKAYFLSYYHKNKNVKIFST